MTEPLLDLDTLIVRPTIAIDGARYDILSPDELSVLDHRRFALWAQQLDKLQQDGAGEDDPALEALVDRMARKVAVGVPDAVFAKLSGAHRIELVEVFTGLLLRSRLRAAGAAATAMGNLPNGARLFPGSSDFTAEPPGSGWRKRLLAWFGLT